ncbi:YaiI/YqxD family protein [Roseomonas populi]|uniref:UPF0178 protein NRP21_00485 n=1 Tax=Roseomonas populi TaxID=3121582 RepID=A0ABT1WZI0_9PROT|nr:YaiI/YqxD family protein [Roseomonas pecuniae]MCR0980523.1 YaiI/YqxD family protein [Roseomonas pecuniae]
MDGDACPVRDEVFRVAGRLSLPVTVVSNGSRGVRLPEGVRRVIVEEGADAADDWIVEAIGPNDICVTADIPLASRCLAKGALAVAPAGRVWDSENIGSAMAGREISRHLRETGMETRHAGFTNRNRSLFLEALERTVQQARRPASAQPRPLPDFFSD